MVLRALPVVFACQGCAQFGDAAHEAAAVLERDGYAEMAWLGAPGADGGQLASKARSRFPIFAIDGCARRCAVEWLAARGVSPQRRLVLA